jgi:hypothetical protein
LALELVDFGVCSFGYLVYGWSGKGKDDDSRFWESEDGIRSLN